MRDREEEENCTRTEKVRLDAAKAKRGAHLLKPKTRRFFCDANFQGLPAASSVHFLRNLVLDVRLWRRALCERLAVIVVA